MKRTLIKLAVTVLALWLALRNVGWQEARDAFTTQDPRSLYMAALFVGLQTLLGGLRWHAIRRALEPGLPAGALHTAKLYYMGNFFNIAMPGTLGGDAARALLLKYEAVPLTRALPGIVVDRLVSLLGMVALIASTAPILCAYLNIGVAWGYIVSFLFWFSLLAGYAIVNFLLRKLAELFSYPWVGMVIENAHSAMARPSLLALSLACAAGAHLCYASAGYALSLGLGMDISWLSCVVFIPLVLLISTMPITLGGWGVREVSMVSLLAMANIPAAHALIVSLQLGLMTVAVSLGGGLVYLVYKKQDIILPPQ